MGAGLGGASGSVSGISEKTYGVVWREGERFKAPDWRQYRVEDIKELKWTQDELAKKGLKNPWLRNDVWKYQGYPGVVVTFGRTVFRGFGWAAVLMAITIAADKMFGLKRDMHPPHLRHHHENSIHD